MSVGFVPVESSDLPGGRGKLYKKGLLREISLVCMPANLRAQVTQVKAFDPINPREFERHVRDALGLSSRQAKKLMAGGWNALVRDERSDNSAELAAIARQLEKITNSFRT